MKARLANGQTTAQVNQLQAARAKRWDNHNAAEHAAKMRVGVARRVLSDLWPEGLREFETALAAKGACND